MDGKALFKTTCDLAIGKSRLLLHLNISGSQGKVAATSGVPWTPWLPPCTLGVPDWRLPSSPPLLCSQLDKIHYNTNQGIGQNVLRDKACCSSGFVIHCQLIINDAADQLIRFKKDQMNQMKHVKYRTSKVLLNKTLMFIRFNNCILIMFSVLTALF